MLVLYIKIENFRFIQTEKFKSIKQKIISVCLFLVSTLETLNMDLVNLLHKIVIFHVHKLTFIKFEIRDF